MNGTARVWGVPLVKRRRDWPLLLASAAIVYGGWFVAAPVLRSPAGFDGDGFFLPLYVSRTLAPPIPALVSVWLLSPLAALVGVGVAVGVSRLGLAIRTAMVLLAAALATSFALGITVSLVLDLPVGPRACCGYLFLGGFAGALRVRARPPVLFGMAPQPLPTAAAVDRDAAERRGRALARARRAYTPVRPPAANLLHPYPLTKRYPWSAAFDLRYYAAYLPTLLRYLLLRLYNRAKHPWVRFTRISDPFGDYAALFSSLLPPPPFRASFMTDAAFVRFRVAGPNVQGLRRLQPGERAPADVLEEVFPGLPRDRRDALLTSREGGGTLATAIADGRAHVLRYELLERALADVPRHRRDAETRRTKYITRPAALFVERAAQGCPIELAPVAIRIDLEDDRVYRPDVDGVRWDIAKIYVHVADHDAHYLGTHLGRCHFFMDAIASSVPRCLSPDHPLHVLLEPHLRYTLPSNRPALRRLERRSWGYDDVFAPELATCRRIVAESRPDGLLELRPDVELALRGLTTTAFPFPYRDDALALWEIIHTFVRDYLACFYAPSGPQSPGHDVELRLWREELEHVLGFTPFSAVGEGALGELVDWIAILLFRAGPAHAAAHYPQIDHFAWVPAFPGAAYVSHRELEDASPAELADFVVRLLPPYGRAVDQFNLANLAEQKLESFGDYRAYRLGYVSDPGVRAAIHGLRVALDGLQARIEARFADPRQPYYPYLLPSRIPNSIHV